MIETQDGDILTVIDVKPDSALPSGWYFNAKSHEERCGGTHTINDVADIGTYLIEVASIEDGLAHRVRMITREFTESERDVIMNFQNYQDGVRIDPLRFKDKFLTTLHDLSERGYCFFDELPEQRAFIGLTDKGWEMADRLAAVRRT